MHIAHRVFSEACCRAFAPLASDFGFLPPAVEPIGPECYVRFHKGTATVSVVWEPGVEPIVEFFYPALPGETSTPWASRDGVAYARRFPSVPPPVPRYDSDSPEAAFAYLERIMALLRSSELQFLSAAHAA